MRVAIRLTVIPALLVVSQAHAAVSVIASLSSHNQVASATNITTNGAVACQVGQTITLFAAYTTITSTLQSVVDSAGNTYSAPVDNVTNTGVGMGFAVAVNIATILPSTTGTITATFSGLTTSEIYARCDGGVAKNNSLDSHNNTSTGLAATSASSVATGALSSADELVFGFTVAPTSFGTVTPTAGFVLPGSSPTTTTPAIAVGTQAVSAASSVAWAPTWTNAVNYVTNVVSLAGLWGGQLALTGGGQH